MVVILIKWPHCEKTAGFSVKQFYSFGNRNQELSDQGTRSQNSTFSGLELTNCGTARRRAHKLQTHLTSMVLFITIDFARRTKAAIGRSPSVGSKANVSLHKDYSL
jgi:hypothetical protein